MHKLRMSTVFAQRTATAVERSLLLVAAAVVQAAAAGRDLLLLPDDGHQGPAGVRGALPDSAPASGGHQLLRPVGEELGLAADAPGAGAHHGGVCVACLSQWSCGTLWWGWVAVFSKCARFAQPAGTENRTPNGSRG